MAWEFSSTRRKGFLTKVTPLWTAPRRARSRAKVTRRPTLEALECRLTLSGVALVADINPGSASGQPDFLQTSGGMLFFTANDGTHGTELWTSNGTPAGTQMVTDINP